MNSTFTYSPKLYAVGYSVLVSLLGWLGGQSAVLGLPLTTNFRTTGHVPNSKGATTWPSAANLSLPGSVSAVEANKCYRLVSRLSGKVIAVDGNAQADGSPIVQRTDANLLTQAWRFATADAGYYNIAVLATQKGIQVTNSSTAEDAPLEQWTYWGGAHQQWRLVRNAEGYYTLINRNANKALGVRNASTADGAVLALQSVGTGQQQQWSIEERSCSATARIGIVEDKEPFSLWPNPARDHVLIDLSPATGQSVGLQLNNMLGNSLQQTHLDAAPAEPYRFTIGQLPDGIYLIRVTPAGQSPTTLRLLIQR